MNKRLLKDCQTALGEAMWICERVRLGKKISKKELQENINTFQDLRTEIEDDKRD